MRILAVASLAAALAVTPALAQSPHNYEPLAPILRHVHAEPYAQPPASVTRDGWRKNRRLRAAAYAFEEVADAALKAPMQQVVQRVRVAQGAADNVFALLHAKAQPRLRAEQGKVDVALKRGHRADLSRAAIETYRTLISSETAPQVPLALSMMVYAGYRYRADLGSRTVLWQDMQDAASLNRAQWNWLAPKLADASLRRRMTRAVSGMQIAVRERNPGIAATSVDRGLRLAERLKTEFAPVPKGAQQ